MKSSLTGTRATDHQYIFIDIVLGLFISSYHDPFSLGEQNVLDVYKRQLLHLGRGSSCDADGTRECHGYSAG